MMRTQVKPRNAAEIDRPTCPSCGSLMWLRGVARPTVGDAERRTFECPVCEVSLGDGHVDDRLESR